MLELKVICLAWEDAHSYGADLRSSSDESPLGVSRSHSDLHLQVEKVSN